MSKSDPASAIFMEDSEAEVRTKIKKAFAAPGEVGWAAAPSSHLSRICQFFRSLGSGISFVVGVSWCAAPGTAPCQAAEISG